MRWRAVECALGSILVAASERGLSRVVLPGERGARELESWRDRHAPNDALVEDRGGLEEVARQVRAYAAGELRRFALRLDPRGSAFERAVWQAEEAIPYGETRSYGEIARAIGRPGAARAVGSATGRNPLPLVVPCHRVLAADGLGGFGGGLALKRRLLALEGVALDRCNRAGGRAVSEACMPPTPRPRTRAAGSSSSNAPWR